ncbi:AGC protein kinase [Saprolegnia diclina VS20]|uniref:non-specific serine/threonine protein kinase n=1 Tax=Saprolegnia diclina (strain VS20) TaxID=1156394 RepID=T0RP00_SAPDV|nr:AGC protein kinase [Saprolegnia diclina VS20]EQC34148.1 AGC protein kinase [Saprolegnia diclina VS20]|eukprot:XP_008612460.1 AGC protein kinase [Saprolegnia diclina VS20]
MTMGSSSGNSNLISPCTSDDSIDDHAKFDLDTMAAYLVKDLDSGQSYRVEEIDQQYVTLEAMKEKLSESHDLLALYSADATTEVEIENTSDSDKDDDDPGYVEEVDVVKHRTSELQPCQFAGCTLFHTRRSGYCETHEVRAKEEEDSRAQALYLIPLGRQASFVEMKGHSFVEDSMFRLYTVFTVVLRCGESTWSVYRRYREFTALYDKLKLRPRLRLPTLPPKKIIGSFEPEFLARRQYELGQWLDQLLTYEPLSNATNPHECDEVVRFLTWKADQPPFPVEQPADFLNLQDSSSNAPRVNLTDFKMIQVIGRGSFGKVVLVGHHATKKLYAMKMLNKANIVKRKQVEHTRTERRVLGYTKHPFIVGLHFAFQTPQRLYFVLDYCPGGELFYHLTRMKKLPEHMACYYAAEITLALEHLHGLGVVYRDLKPENILLTKEGHVKLADFGLAKEGITDGVYGTNSLCGTPEYLPPEILDRLGHGTAVDWWNLGMVLYEMLTGLPPWYTNDRQKLFDRLRSARLHFPPYVSRRAEGLIRALLNRNPAERLGARGAAEVKAHPFFESIEWDDLLALKMPPPFRPCRATTTDDTPLNFEAEFTRLPLPSVEVVDKETKQKARANSDTFSGFAYENPDAMQSSL